MDDPNAERAGDSPSTRSDPLTRTMAEEQESSTLPREIWFIIFTMVVDPESLHHDYCTSFDFPRFHHEWDMLRRSASIDINKQITLLRLVCRLWSLLIESTWRPYLNTYSSQRINSYTDIRALCLELLCEWESHKYKPYPLDQVFLGATRNINTLIIYYSNHSGFIESILLHPEYFPSVRSFYYLTRLVFPHEFWTRLENAFPRLTALTLIGPGQEGESITLPDLKILDIALSTRTPPSFRFPSLKHFASDIAPCSASSEQILWTHGEHIESIILSDFGFPNHYQLLRGDF